MRTRGLLIIALGASLATVGCGAPAGGEDSEEAGAENEREEEDDE